MISTEKLFIQGIEALEAENYAEAEKKLKKVARSKADQSKKAQIILAALSLKEECENLLRKLDNAGG
ncbi:MAG: hypothetical protein AMJ90_03210 [candidate division Zixibacteria bacterium SM23_73_2]|nr:MAG: hypothetical protein AMJ90_03210 [candidate division Zixibacteria bacterium SM23_73_2]